MVSKTQNQTSLIMRTVLFTVVALLIITSCAKHEPLSSTQASTETLSPFIPGMTFILQKNPLDTTNYIAIGGWPDQSYHNDMYKEKAGPVFCEGDPLPVGTEVNVFVTEDSTRMYKSEQGFTTSIQTGKKLIAKPVDKRQEASI